jgi:S1-C subfamily serine protease
MRNSDDTKMALLGMVVVFGALLACGNKIDQKKLDGLIEGMFEDQLELEVDEIDCPKDVKVEEGKEFECEVTVKPKGKVPVVVEITDSSGTVNAKTKYKVLAPRPLAKEIQEGLRGKGINAEVDCGDEIRLAKPGKEFACTASAGAESKDVNVTIDDEGEASWKM